ncbi:enoyl-CoA hydratase/isomerase family protein [Saccharopolyspora sp. NPDC049357]|uniref:enoyl-CoA hydratase/isomerase family protein n=1 Tax=Saccharopolyspora sp. NPDC049357 TaxID=3154507 RepID=UPI0034176FBC
MPDQQRAEVRAEGVRIERDGTLGRIVLDQPKSLNALTLEMVAAIERALLDWLPQPLSTVIIESSDERAFCAGGDIRAIRQNTLEGRHEVSERFFATEYRVNALLADYPHPVISLIDGICLGGGLGLSVHGPFRVVTESATLAMPETGIGFFPDVGASYFLPRLPGAIGTYLGLTGERLDAADALAAGLATHYCASSAIGELPELLRSRGQHSVDEVLRNICTTPTTPAVLSEHRPAIDQIFGATSVEQIRCRLRAADTTWASDHLQILDRMSPQSLDLTFDLLTRGRERKLIACLTAELRAAHHVTHSLDFIEGVRAALVDKDRSPAWSTDSAYLGVDAEGEPLWSDALNAPEPAPDLDPWSVLPEY